MKSGRCTCDAQILPDVPELKSADLQIAKGDAFVNDPRRSEGMAPRAQLYVAMRRVAFMPWR
ncbi:hypothetical protein AGR5A_pb0117 [Agrobacterium genomosp. 5 str. CFBP 6626]|nr:hypothetical protein AGR5A_pb0117 [Agrobacterium genomosp. 5 str. CFBP 6626]